MAPEERPSASLSGTIKVFLFDFALVSCQSDIQYRKALMNKPIEYDLSRSVHLTLRSRPLYSAIFFLDRRSLVIFRNRNFRLSLLRRRVQLQWWIFSLHLYRLGSPSCSVLSCVKTSQLSYDCARVCCMPRANQPSEGAKHTIRLLIDRPK